MRKLNILSLLLINCFLAICLSCGSQSTSNSNSKDGVSDDLLLKNKFHFENTPLDLSLTFKENKAFSFEYSTEAINWDGGNNEGTYEIKNGKLLLHSKKCDLRGELIDCKDAMGEAEGSTMDSAGTKYLVIKFLNKKKDYDLFPALIKFPVVDKNFDDCAEITKEHAKTSTEPCKILGKWASEDGKIEYEFKENEYSSSRTEDINGTSTTNTAGGTFKISNVQLPRQCFRDEAIDGLKNGKFINMNSNISIFAVKYSIKGDKLILEWENGTKDMLKKK